MANRTSNRLIQSYPAISSLQHVVFTLTTTVGRSTSIRRSHDRLLFFTTIEWKETSNVFIFSLVILRFTKISTRSVGCTQEFESPYSTIQLAYISFNHQYTRIKQLLLRFFKDSIWVHTRYLSAPWYATCEQVTIIIEVGSCEALDTR